MTITSGLKVAAATIGNSATDTQNFQLSANNDGTLKLARKSDGSGGDILTVDVTGKVAVNQGLASGSLIETGAAGVGYGVGSGGTVTQITSKATTVTLNKPTGQITMNNAALASGALVQFNMLNSLIAATDTIVANVNLAGVATAGVYSIRPCISAGLAQISVKNESGVSLSEALVINFTLIKGAAS